MSPACWRDFATNPRVNQLAVLDAPMAKPGRRPDLIASGFSAPPRLEPREFYCFGCRGLCRRATVSRQRIERSVDLIIV
jgi:hypothetical protein